MRIVVLEPLMVAKNTLEGLFAPLTDQGHVVEFCDKKTDDLMELIGKCKGADVVVVENQSLPGKILEACPNIRMVSVATGFRDQVDLNKARSKLISVCAVPDPWTHSLAELAVALVLAVIRRIVPGNLGARGQEVTDSIEGRELFGKTVGIIGLGPEGLYVAKMLGVFGCELLGYDENWSREAEALGNIEKAGLDDLLERSDIVTVHVPRSLPDTILDREKIGKMKKGAILVNIDNPEAVDYKALASALKKGKLSGAGLDVFDAELPLPASHPLSKAPNTVFTPGFGTSTPEGLEKRIQTTIDNITSWINGKPENVVV